MKRFKKMVFLIAVMIVPLKAYGSYVQEIRYNVIDPCWTHVLNSKGLTKSDIPVKQFEILNDRMVKGIEKMIAPMNTFEQREQIYALAITMCKMHADN